MHARSLLGVGLLRELGVGLLAARDGELWITHSGGRLSRLSRAKL